MNRIIKLLKTFHCSILISLTALVIQGCKDEWKNKGKLANQSDGVNLFTAISARPELSLFKGYLVKTGYDKVLNQNRTFTVWAPTNQAMSIIDPSLTSDTAWLARFVSYHLSLQSYRTAITADSIFPVKTLNGKLAAFSKLKFEDGPILSADIITGNGVLHEITLPVVPKLNVWQYLQNLPSSNLKTFFNSLNYLRFDSINGIQQGVDPRTGKPVYKPGSGLTPSNIFLDSVVNLANEDKKFTFFYVTDAVFATEQYRLFKYYQGLSTDSTIRSTQFSVATDLVVQGISDPANLPDTLQSINGLRFHVNSSNITSSQRVSNGIVYQIASIQYPLSNKIRPIVIDGASKFVVDGRKPFNIISRLEPSTGKVFRQVKVEKHGVAGLKIGYSTPLLNSVRYKFYFNSYRDFNVASPVIYFRLAIGYFQKAEVAGATSTFIQGPYQQINLYNYLDVDAEISVILSRQQRAAVYLVGNDVTTDGRNTLLLRYIKMVPQLP